jgi:cytochrome P450
MRPLRSQKSLPAGRLGLPVIGQMLAYAANPFQFIEDRIADYGPVFKSRLLLHKAVVIAGPDACERFINPSLVQRAGAYPPFVQKLFGGRSLPFLDGEVHLGRKEIVLQALAPAALSTYVPTMQRIVETTFQNWCKLGEFQLIEGLKRLAFETICANILGLAPGSELTKLQKDYEAVTAGIVSLPIPVPGTRYWKALRARNDIFATLRPILEQRKQSPRSDGVSTILSASSSDGTQLTVDEALLETHHMIIAGFIIFAEMASVVLFSRARNAVRPQLVQEIQSIPKDRMLSLGDLEKLRHVGEFVMEVKRLCPIIPAVFGKAKKDFEIYGVTVPAGWLVLWAVRSTNIFRDSFPHRMQFDPNRFDVPPKNPFAFVPQGGGPVTGHRCGGLDYSTLLMQIFTIVLMRDYIVQVKNPDPVYDWKLNPPQPDDGLPATVSVTL